MPRTIAKVTLSLLLATLVGAASAQDDSEDEHLLPGLAVKFTGDCNLHFDCALPVAAVWRPVAAVRRIAPAAGDPQHAVTAAWRGRLLSQVAGDYRLHVYVQGKVTLRLAGKLLIEGDAAEPKWLHSERVRLEYGYHPLEIDFSGEAGGARIGLYWDGPGFQLEPVAVRFLAHSATDAEDVTSSDALLGRKLLRQARCAACHEVNDTFTPAPALDKLAGNLSQRWLTEYLTTPVPEQNKPKLPQHELLHFDISKQQARELAAFLAGEPAKVPSSKPIVDSGDAARGQALVRSLGCVACHEVDHRETYYFNPGDLSRVASKRPRGYFQQWLENPASLNADHAMPVFTLSAAERSDVAAYLATLGEVVPGPLLDPAAFTADERASGQKLAEAYRCQACHRLPKQLAAVPKLALDLKELDQPKGCLDFENAEFAPKYQLDELYYFALLRRLEKVRESPKSSAPARSDPLLVLQEHRCLSCHARGDERGLRHRLGIAGESDAADQLAAGPLPPTLDGIGDKLSDAGLRAAIVGKSPPRRPWLPARMPQFKLSQEEIDALATYFIDVDRIPAGARPAPLGLSKPPANAEKLVIAEGFGCTSCHSIGKFEPEKVALNARGPNLANLDQHVRREWFDRWVRNPARIVPKMEMPAVQQPVRGILGGDLDRQLAAVWSVLSQPGFVPPKAGALRVVRASVMPAPGEAAPRANVLTDMIELDERRLVKPLVIGLPNRHNILFDLAENELAAWWVGDTARQYTRGKSWYWQASGKQLVQAGPVKPVRGWGELSLIFGEQIIEPISPGIYRTEFDTFEHISGSVRFTQRLQFKLDGKTHTVHLAQTFESHLLDATAEPDRAAWRGFKRTLVLKQVPPGAVVRLAIFPRTVRGQVNRAGTFQLPLDNGSLEIFSDSADAPRPTMHLGAPIVELRPDVEHKAQCELIYRTDMPDDPPRAVVDRGYIAEKKTLDVAPGWRMSQLPLPTEIMPTGLAWWPNSKRPSGHLPGDRLVITSLEGRVWLAEDTDADGLEDRAWAFSDELAAPWGAAADEDALNVINKYALLRLTDADGDGRCDATETRASGWPHTLDYHDWAVGLPRDAAGAFYIALPCQQDKRTAAAASMRGSVLRLSPRVQTSDDPHRYAIEPLAAGLRFPMGIARSRYGELFVTDNQGNYTAFNELNHIVRGARFGFINSSEAQPGFDPPFQPAAIEIPHPWTRSVNGICFLDTPAALRKKLGHDLFGCFEGHLIGCEYDTRRLVRMSLEKVAGTWQGAVYPLSTEPQLDPQATFEGPLTAQVSPGGMLYVGSIRDSGWGAGSNTGSIVQMQWLGNPPAGIAEVQAKPYGFAVRFTQPVDEQLASKLDNYSLESYRRVPTPDYGGPDRDRRREPLGSVELSADRCEVRLQLAELREGFVYELRLKPLVKAGPFFPAEAYYTLRKRP